MNVPDKNRNICEEKKNNKTPGSKKNYILQNIRVVIIILSSVLKFKVIIAFII